MEIGGRFKTFHFCPVILVLFLNACLFDPDAIQVGEFIIKKSAVNCRDAVITASFPEDKRKLGRDQLIQSYKNVQVLKSYGVEITPEKIKKEKELINATTLTPDKLAQIKTSCGGEDSKAYEMGYVIPNLADRIIYYDFYLKTESLHQESYSKAELWRLKVSDLGSQFETLAKQENIPVSFFKVSLKKGLELHRAFQKKGPQTIKETLLSDAPPVPVHVDPKLKKEQEEKNSQEGQKWIDEILSPLKAGEVSKKVIDQGEMWLVVRYLKPTPWQKDSYEIQAAIFPKRPFPEWLEVEKQKIKLTIFDKE